VAPQLIENKNNYYDNMGGGASGSMIIENTSHKIAGIY
jgi:hypothetical protein